jgi:hypothetical protein
LLEVEMGPHQDTQGAKEVPAASRREPDPLS